MERIVIKDDCIFEHTEIHFNYTTYDVRRKADIIRTTLPERANIMVLADPDAPNPGPEDAPRSNYLYARVVKAYHAHVYCNGVGFPSSSPVRFDFLWVRWYELGREASYSLRALRFNLVLGSSTFDFVDPSDVLRAVHIIPTFRYGRRRDHEMARSAIAGDEEDWMQYYVGR